MGLFSTLFNSEKRAGLLKTVNGEIIDPRLISFIFETDELSERPGDGFYYLLGKDNTRIALSFLPVLNRVIKSAKKECKGISNRLFSEKQFEKQVIRIDYLELYTLQLTFNSLTKAKHEIPKYPFTVHYQPNEQLFATIDFNKEGSPEKIEITVWGKAVCHVIKAAFTNNLIVIKSIYENDCMNKTKVYPK